MIENNYFELALERVKKLDLSSKREECKNRDKKLGVLGLLVLEQFRRNALWLDYNIRVNNTQYKRYGVCFANPILGDMEWYSPKALLPMPIQTFIEDIDNTTMRISIEKYLTWHFCYEYIKTMGFHELPDPHEPMLYYAQMIDYYPRIGPTVELFWPDFGFPKPKLEVFSEIKTPFILLTEEDFATKEKEYLELGDKFWDKYVRIYTSIYDRTKKTA